jgi:LVIVD repeat
MRRTMLGLLTVPALLLGSLSSAAAAPAAPAQAGSADSAPVTVQSHVPDPVRPGTAENFTVVGSHPLFARGMNAAPAVYGDYVYVGNRTDGSEGHERPGVLVVDASDPAAPRVVGEIGPPNAGNIGETTRELRVWPQERLLLVLGFTCSSAIHDCPGVRVTPTIKFYDLADPAAPALVSTYVPSRTPHEFFLWVDPRQAGRALLYSSTPTGELDLPNLIVTDISGARDGRFEEIAHFNPNERFPEHVREDRDVSLHSLGVNYSGTRLHLAYLGGGYLVADSSELARDVADPRIRLITPVSHRVPYPNPGAHSAVKVPGRPYVVLTEEVYGDLLDELIGADEHGCPWGWLKVADIRDPRRPQVVGEFRLRENQQSYCRTPAGQDPDNVERTSYAAHNPTVLPGLALVTWHSGGLQAVSLRDPVRPRQTGEFLPTPLPEVTTEDPALSEGRNQVVMWSYPIIKDGLVYVTDVRNGLFILRYTGEGHRAVDRISFLEGNSNLGDAARLGD